MTKRSKGFVSFCIKLMQCLFYKVCSIHVLIFFSSFLLVFIFNFINFIPQISLMVIPLQFFSTPFLINWNLWIFHLSKLYRVVLSFDDRQQYYKTKNYYSFLVGQLKEMSLKFFPLLMFSQQTTAQPNVHCWLFK